MIKPLLSIIIVNFNTCQITLDCIASIFKDKKLSFSQTNSTDHTIPCEIILIDNASQDNSVSIIKKKYPQVIIIENKTNVGFGAANNQGIKIAQGNYLLLLNSDTIILHSAISQSLEWLSSHPESLCCTAQLLNADKTIQASGGYFPNLLNCFTWLTCLDDLPFINQIIKPFHPHTPNFYTHDNFYTKDHSQDWLTGAFMLFRQEAIVAVNGFSKDFFMYGEEMEMCYRISKKFPNQTFDYLIGPQIIHLGGKSTKDKQQIFDREYLGIETFFKIHQPKWQLPIIRFLISINRFLKKCLK
ncbi:MAG TPA: glycosyltransferase family 2 protein [Candidatus Woesebacteria bacterium]|nr:glycosyltransferase family 2 protein [Candidatus Woesebacteria bacterium]HPJ17030.1 glycosyltransferase family 2 protein [Candidatus Woesebacteria bacterium]